MNITHRSIWNAALGAWVAVSEITRACGKRSGAAVALAVGLTCASAGAQTIIDNGAVETVPGTRGSTWDIIGQVRVGQTGQGTLTVSGGGAVSNTGLASIANNVGSTGIATVTGPTSTWTNNLELYVGYGGNGTLTISDGGTVSNTDGYIGSNATSTSHAAVTGADSTWTNNGRLFVGHAGNGTLSVAAGGSVSNTSGVIGYSGIGNATVTGVNSTWSNGVELFVGQLGSGTLTVADGGHVSVNNGNSVLNVAVNAGSTGVLNIGAAVGSAATAAGTIGASEVQFGAGSGSLNFNHTETAYTFGTPITGAGVVNHHAGTTILTGANTYTGATTVSGGTLRAGAVNTLSSSSAFTLANTAGATLDLNNFNQTIGSLSGGGATGGNITLGSGTITTGGNNSSTSYGGVISGSGGVTKQGSGKLNLTGTNTYTGATTISGGTITISDSVNLGASGGTLTFGGGTLQTTGSVSMSRATTLNGGGGTFDTDALTTLSHGGAIDGTGALTKTGAGTLRLTGTNSYQGGTTINGGTVAIFADANLGNAAGGLAFDGGTLQMGAAVASARAITLNAGGGTVDTNGNNATLNGVMSGGGAFTKTGAGTVTLTGANTYTGGTTVFAGTLVGNTASLQGNITNNADVVFDQTTTGSYAGVMSGTGTLAKSGAGNLNLAGVNFYTGATTVSGGTLSVNGSITSPVTVNSGGALGGGGTINGAVNIGSGGAFAPGNSIGTLTVNGNVNFAAGSIYRVEVDAAGNADRINVTGAPGTATLNGGTVDVQAGAGSYQANTRYTILNATGGVTGTFNTVTSNLAFLTPTLSYDPNNVFLALARNDISFTSVAATSNQQASATALQVSTAGATGDMATVVNAVTGLSAPQARAAYDAIGGASLVALRRAGETFAGGFGQQLNRRLGVVAPGDAARQVTAFGSPLLLAANDWQADAQGNPQRMAQAGMGATLDSAQQRPDPRGFWLRGYGAGSNTDSDGNAAAGRLRGGGFSAGIDAEVSEGLVLGAALTSGTSRVSFDNSADAGRSRGNAFGVYGSFVSSAWAFKGVASLAWNANHMDRAVAVGPLIRTASSDFDSRSQSLYAEATYDLPQASYLLQPLAVLSYVRTKTDGFTETGAGALSLQVLGQTTTSTRTLLGAKTVHKVGSLKVEPRLLWAHEFGNVNAPLAASLTGAPGAGSFQVSGVALKRDSLVLGLGVSGQIGKGLALVADAQLEGNARQRNLAFFVALHGTW